MKKNCILALILALVCLMTCVPVNAAEPRATICLEHGPFDYGCGGSNEEQKVHYFMVSGYAKMCEYTHYTGETWWICNVCYEMGFDSYHDHGDQGHDDVCGGTNTKWYNVCLFT